MNKHRILALALSAALTLGTLGVSASAAGDGDVDEAVAVLSDLGIVSGYSDGQYHPEDGLTRAQFCKLAVLAEGHGDQAAGSAYRSLFSDVASSSWAASYVNLAYEEGLVAGKGDGTFGPDESVTLGQAVTVCLRLLGYTESDIGPFWPEDYVSKARTVGLLDGITGDGGTALTRGQAALMLNNLLYEENTQGKTFGLTLAATSVANAVLLDNDDEALDGTLHTLCVYANGNLTWYEQSSAISDSLTCRKGTLLLDKAGKAMGFLPDDSVTRTVSAETVTASSVKDGVGNEYSLTSDVTVVSDGEKTTFGNSWYDLEGRTLTLYYAESGGVTLVSASDAVASDGTLLTGYYENASPNTASPTSITLLGHVFTVADGAAGLSGHAVGDKITIALNGSGEVARMWSASERSTTVAAILDDGDKGTFTHVSGIALTSTITSGDTAALKGCLVKISATAAGKCSISALSGGALSGTLNVAAKTVGSVALSDNVKIYDQVSGAPAVEIALSDILSATVPAASLTYVGTDANGKVDLILLKNVTGDAYTYGFYRTSTVASGKEDTEDYYEYNTVAVESSAGTSVYCASVLSLKYGAVGGMAVTGDSKVAGTAELTKTSAARSDFDGEDAVVVKETRVPLASDLQVYNNDTKRWITLAEAKAYDASLTVYYSGTLGGNAKVRVVTVG